MKATSKLISVVLILAMCLSLFTVSAFAAPGQTVVIGGGMIESEPIGGPATNSWVGANRVQQATNQPAVIEDNSYQGSADAETDTATDAAAQTAPAVTEQVTETVPAITEVSTAEELKAAAAKGGEIKLLNDIAMSEGLTVAANAVIDLNGKILSFDNAADDKGMAITGMGATLKNGTVSAKGSVLASDNGTVEIGFGSVASGVTLNNVNVRFYAPAEWTMFGQGVGLVYGTYNRDVSNYFAGSEKLEVVEQNGIYTVRDKVEAPAVIPAVTENAETPAAETEQTDVAAEEPVTETEQTNAAAEEPAAETEQTDVAVEEPAAETEQADVAVEETNTADEQNDAETTQADVEVEGDDANVEGNEAAVEGDEAAVEGDDVAVEGDEAAVEGDDAAVEGDEAAVEGDDAAAEGDEAAVEGDDAAAEGEQTDENALPESDEQQANETPADEEPADETPVNVVEEKEEEPVTEEEIRADLEAENAEEPDAVTLTGTDPVTGAVVIVTGKNLPEGLSVVVKPLSLDTIDGLAEDERAVLALDISLVDAEGNEYEPKDDPNVGAVSVKIQHASLGNLEEDETLNLYHVEGDVTRTVGSAEQNGENTLDFATGSFSPFIITASSGKGTANTGSMGETHNRKVSITNLTGDVYVKGGKANERLIFRIDGGVVPESISVVDPDNVSSGNASIYKDGYMIYDDIAATSLGTGTHDYAITKDFAGANPQKIGDPSIPISDPVYVTFNKEALANAPTGKWAFVFWFRDTTDSGAQRVYMVQYVTIVPEATIKALGPVDEFGDFYFNKCSYDPLEIFITADLDTLSITDSTGKTVVSYDYTKDPKHVYVNTKEYPNKTFNYGDVFQITDYKVSGDLMKISDYVTEDPVTHEFIGGKTLKIFSELLRKLDFDEYTISLSQKNHQKHNTTAGEKPYENVASASFKLSLLPGIAVADGLDDYIKGKNVWIKFVSCWPIDYDDDGTLAIWIGGQKISKDYYSISNDHQTLWIYRNLLDQLRSNNSYTLTARLWRLNKTDGHREYFYPAQASFNILAAGSTSYKSPKTGDNSNVALWAAVAVLSGGAVVALIPKKKRVSK